MGQISVGVTCTECRAQYEKAGRSDDVPCDVDVCKYKPSPGDTGESGCGLLPQNDFAVWLYPRWKAFGNKVFDYLDDELSPNEGQLIVEKFMMIEQYAPSIAEKNQKRAASTSIPRKKK